MSISLFGQGGAVPAWKQMETWRAKQKQFVAEAESLNAGLTSALANTLTSTSEGMIQLTVRKAVAAAQQRAAARAKLNRVDTSI